MITAVTYSKRGGEMNLELCILMEIPAEQTIPLEGVGAHKYRLSM